jgi:hypothetical protein
MKSMGTEKIVLLKPGSGYTRVSGRRFDAATPLHDRQ